MPVGSAGSAEVHEDVTVREPAFALLFHSFLSLCAARINVQRKGEVTKAEVDTEADLADPTNYMH